MKVLEMAVKYQTLIVEDDPYGDLYFGEKPPPSILALSKEVPGSREWIAHCGSMSKVLSPGLRVGLMIAPPDLLAKATMCKQFSDAHTSTFAQATAAQYLKSGRMPDTLARVRKVYAERAQAMAQSPGRGLSDQAQDRESAYERLQARAAQPAPAPMREPEREVERVDAQRFC